MKLNLGSGSKILEKESPNSFSPEKALNTTKSEVVVTTTIIKANVFILFTTVCLLFEKK